VWDVRRMASNQILKEVAVGRRRRRDSRAKKPAEACCPRQMAKSCPRRREWRSCRANKG
jgi:hypothetical protein